MLFQGMAVVLYGTLAADIRIKSIAETHQEHTLRILAEAIKAAASPGDPEVPESTIRAMVRGLEIAKRE